MRIGWIGVHAEGIPALKAICAADYDVVGMMTLRTDKAERRCGSADYDALCDRYDIPVYHVDHVNDESSQQVLQNWDCDLLVVLGWGQLLSAAVLNMARIGVVGAHASVLPHNRGSAPVNWAIIRDEQYTGNTLMWLEEGVDSGDIIDQRSFEISPYDNCATIYDKVAESNREMMLDLCFQLQTGQRPGRVQQHSDEPILPRRRPADGEIDWNASGKTIYNMIRGLTRPYPGAFATINGESFKIWQAALLPAFGRPAVPGTLLGPVCSSEAAACGQLVATTDGALLLLEVEDTAGHVLKGRQLSDLNWIQKRERYAA